MKMIKVWTKVLLAGSATLVAFSLFTMYTHPLDTLPAPMTKIHDDVSASSHVLETNKLSEDKVQYFYLDESSSTTSNSMEFTTEGNLLGSSSTTVQNQFQQPSTSDTSCVPHYHLYYLKAHKSGSTTIANMLTRIGLRENLTFAMFEGRSHAVQGDWSNTIYAHAGNSAQPLPQATMQNWTNRYDLVNIHTIFHEQNIINFMKADSFVLATLRHPLDQLKSSFYHYHLNKLFDDITEDSTESFELLLREGPELFQENSRSRDQAEYYARHRMAREFGMDLSQITNVTYVDEYLKYVDKRFEQVIITEHFEEGLIMFKEKACWTLKDIVYLAQRNNTYKAKGKSPAEYGTLLSRHKLWNPVDYKLYEHFLNKHQRAVSEYGPTLREKLADFSVLLDNVSEFCAQVCTNLSTLNKSLDSLKSLLFEQFIDVYSPAFMEDVRMGGSDCVLMMLDSTVLKRAILARQYGWACGHGYTGPFDMQDFCPSTQSRLDDVLYGINFKVLTAYRSYLSCTF